MFAIGAEEQRDAAIWAFLDFNPKSTHAFYRLSTFAFQASYRQAFAWKPLEATLVADNAMAVVGTVLSAVLLVLQLFGALPGHSAATSILVSREDLSNTSALTWPGHLFSGDL